MLGIIPFVLVRLFGLPLLGVFIILGCVMTFCAFGGAATILGFDPSPHARDVSRGILSLMARIVITLAVLTGPPVLLMQSGYVGTALLYIVATPVVLMIAFIVSAV